MANRTDNLTDNPRCVGLMFADDVRADASGKGIIYGIMTNIVSQAMKFPMMHQMGLYAGVTGITGDFAMLAVLNGPGIDGPVIASHELKVTGSRRNQVNVIHLGGVFTFPRPGEYFLRVLYRDVVLGQTSLGVGSKEQIKAWGY